MRGPLWLTCAFAVLSAAATMASCSTGGGNGGSFDSGPGPEAGDDSMGMPGDGAPTDVGSFGDGSGGDGCAPQCSPDGRSVVDCHGATLQTCNAQQACDPTTGQCANACDVAVHTKQSIGCEYYATYMEMQSSGFWTADQVCFAVIVANTWTSAAHVNVDYIGQKLAIDSYAYTPTGSGPTLKLTPANVSSQGVPAGGVAILFLVGAVGTEKAHCPVQPAMTGGAMVAGTGIGHSFHVTTDVPVVSYEIMPYGGGNAAVTGSSLLIPTSAWDVNYIAADAYVDSISNPEMNIVALQDGTTVKMVPVVDVVGGGGLPSGSANKTMQFTLDHGQFAQFSQSTELTGSVIQSDKPIGLMAGQSEMLVPMNVYYADHGEQMIPPVRAMGAEFAGVMYRPRLTEVAIWRVVGAVDGTQLTWTSNVGGPATIGRGQVAEFQTGTPFDVKSQDDKHPFLLFEHMSGSTWQPGMDGYGDADFVLQVPPQQYLSHYVFFADPTYPETNLVVIRTPDNNGKFADVTLDCAGKLSGWQSVGAYEWTRVDLSTGDFQGVGNCSTGRHEMTSTQPFGLTVWGWGTPKTTTFTSNVSYGYPAGMNVTPINTVVIPPTPK
jgi:hypothetical protein